MSISAHIISQARKNKNKNTLERIMIFGKSERKRGSMGAAVIVGALALVGAASITAKGKMLVKGTLDKAKCMMSKKESC